MATEVPGDPAALRDAAARIRHVRARAQDAASAVERGRAVAAGGWSGAAHDAFAGASASTAVRAGTMAQYVMAADVLETYAAALEDAQRRYSEAMSAWTAADPALGYDLDHR